MTTAFLLSGGGSLGAVQVGMLQALADREVRPDLLVGTSAGALNAAYLAGHGTGRAAVDALALIWEGLRTSSVFHLEARRALLAVAGRRRALVSSGPLSTLIDRHLTFARLEDAPLPVWMMAADLLSGEAVALGQGPALSAVLASCAIPGVLEPVERDGRTLVDGALADSCGIATALRAGAETIYILPTGYSCALPRPPSTPLGILAQSMSLLLHQRLVADIAEHHERADVVVLPPPCPIRVSPLDFRHTAALVRRGYAAALESLDAVRRRDGDPARHIAVHRHPLEEHQRRAR